MSAAWLHAHTDCRAASAFWALLACCVLRSNTLSQAVVDAFSGPNLDRIAHSRTCLEKRTIANERPDLARQCACRMLHRSILLPLDRHSSCHCLESHSCLLLLGHTLLPGEQQFHIMVTAARTLALFSFHPGASPNLRDNWRARCRCICGVARCLLLDLPHLHMPKQHPGIPANACRFYAGVRTSRTATPPFATQPSRSSFAHSRRCWVICTCEPAQWPGPVMRETLCLRSAGSQIV